MNASDNANRLETTIGRVLRAGILLSSMCLAIGLVFSLAGGAATSRVLLNVGLLVLLATPAARVVISIGVYAFQRDWLFTLLTTIVLLELVGSVVAAFR